MRDSEDQFGLSAGFLSEVVETRIRTGARAGLRTAALETLNAAFEICVLTSGHSGLALPFPCRSAVGPEKRRA